MNPKQISQTSSLFISPFLLIVIVIGLIGNMASAQKTVRFGAPTGVATAELPEPKTGCQEQWIYMTGHSDTDGTNGEVHTFSSGSLFVKASAWSRRKSDSVWRTAYLGRYESGLGVTDRSETGSAHRVDNGGDELNYILFEFDEPVVVDQVYLDAVSGDSDISVWVGNSTDPYNNHLTLSDALLASFGAVEHNNGDASARFANINNSNKVGNVLVVAARVDGHTADAFKIRKIVADCAPPNKGRVEIIKQVFTPDLSNGFDASFNFTATNLGTASFDLVDNNVVGPDRFINPSVSAGTTITVTETAAFGWSLTGLSCTEVGGTTNTSWNFNTATATIQVEAGETVTCIFQNGVAIPTAGGASVSGRAITRTGAPIRDAILTLFDVQTGQTRSVRTNHFGVYRFLDIEVGRFYVLAISHRRYAFEGSTRHFTLSDNLDDVDFIQTF